MKRQQLTIVLVAITLGLVWVSPVSACPSCQAALAADGGRYVNALFWSILFMLAMPFTIVSAFAISIYRATRSPRPLSSAAAAVPVSEVPSATANKLMDRAPIETAEMVAEIRQQESLEV